MLVLKRTEGEAGVFFTAQGAITVTIGRDNKLAIDAPREVKILRKELDRHDVDCKKHK
jgi:sRNA-binding carbon storage regulator CsrA